MADSEAARVSVAAPPFGAQLAELAFVRAERSPSRGWLLCAARPVEAGEVTAASRPYAVAPYGAVASRVCAVCLCASVARACSACQEVRGIPRLCCCPGGRPRGVASAQVAVCAACELPPWHAHVCPALSRLHGAQCVRQRDASTVRLVLEMVSRAAFEEEQPDRAMGACERWLDARARFADVQRLVTNEHSLTLAALAKAAEIGRLARGLLSPAVAPWLDDAGCAGLAMRVWENAFTHFVGDEPVATALHGWPSLSNHDCVGSVIRRLEGPLLWFEAARALAPGDELCHSYADPALPVSRRRAWLREYFAFECDCAKCVSDMAERVAAASAPDAGWTIEGDAYYAALAASGSGE